MERGDRIMTVDEYEELHCMYCDSQRCLRYSGQTVKDTCPYWDIRQKLNSGVIEGSVERDIQM